MQRNFVVGLAVIAAVAVCLWHHRRKWLPANGSREAVEKYGYTVDHKGIHYPEGYMFMQDAAVDTGRSCRVTGNAACINHALDMGRDYPEAIGMCKGTKKNVRFENEATREVWMDPSYTNTYSSVHAARQLS